MGFWGKKPKDTPPVQPRQPVRGAEEKVNPRSPQTTPQPVVNVPEFYSVEPELQPYLSYPRPVMPALSGSPLQNFQPRIPAYEVFSQSVIGQRHINEGMEKEDNCGVWTDPGNGVWAFALGDGHGDPNCVRSKTGSDLVSQIAIQKLRELAEGLHCENRTALLLQKDWQEFFLRQVILSIQTEWDRAVLQDLQARPLTEAEWAQCDVYLESYRKGEALEHLYGTTLIAGLATREYLVLLQQGDGRCDVFHADGSVDQPIPWDDDCVGNATTSMCQPDTWKRCRYCVIDLRKDPVVACFAGSDGVEDSFRTMDDVHTYYRSLLLYTLDHGVAGLERYLATELTRLNQAGSMDDTTVVGIVDLAAAQSLRGIYNRRNEAYRLLNIWDHADEALRSKEGRKAFLFQKYAEAKQRFDSLQQKQADIFRYYHAEQFLNKMGQADFASQNIIGEEYNAARGILESWLNGNAHLQGKREEYLAAQSECEKWESEYRDYCRQYVGLQREKAMVVRDFEALFAQPHIPQNDR